LAEVLILSVGMVHEK